MERPTQSPTLFVRLRSLSPAVTLDPGDWYGVTILRWAQVRIDEVLHHYHALGPQSDKPVRLSFLVSEPFLPVDRYPQEALATAPSLHPWLRRLMRTSQESVPEDKVAEAGLLLPGATLPAFADWPKGLGPPRQFALQVGPARAQFVVTSPGGDVVARAWPSYDPDFLALLSAG